MTVKGHTRSIAALVGVVLAVLPAPRQPAWADTGKVPWQLTAMHAPDAWALSTGAGVTVAVLDSGVDAAHTDLAGRVLPGADFVDGTTDGRHDFVGHGTTVAALIAGRDDTAAGVAGVAPRAKILPVRVLDRANRFSDAAVVANGLRWAVDRGAKVVNMSLGGAARSPQLADAIAYAFAHDVVVVACTGNVIAGQPAQVWYPAREPGVVAVAGLTQMPTGLGLWSGGLTGPDTVLTAPADDLTGARPGGYWQVQGTSFAAPLVAGIAALIRSRWPTMSAANVINRLISTTDKPKSGVGTSDYGYGEVDARAALTAHVPAVSRNPLLTPRPPVTPGPTGPAEGPMPQATPTRTPTATPTVLAATGPIRQQPTWQFAAGTAGLAATVGTGFLLLLVRRRTSAAADQPRPAARRYPDASGSGDPTG